MKRKLLKHNLFWTATVVAACGLILWPLIRQGFFVSDDGEWMIIRLTAFFQTLREGQFPTRFLGRLNYQYGYPVANFLYPGFLYIGSALHVLGASFTDAIKIILGGSVIGSSLFIFSALRRQFDERSSFVGMISYILAPYLTFDLYVRGSVGEILATLPASMGFYSIMAGNVWLFPLAVAFLIVSHNTLAFLFILFFISLIVIRKAWNFWTPFALGIGMASFFWLPALYDRKYVIFNSIQVAEPYRYFLTGSQLLLLGFVGVIAVAIFIFDKKKKDGLSYVMATVFSVSIIMATAFSFPLWNIRSLATVVQFPYRFLMLSVFAGSWIVGRVFTSLKGHLKLGFLILSAIIWFFPLLPIISGITYVSRPMGYYATNEATTTVKDEYMPKWVQIKPTTHADHKFIFYKGGGQLHPLTITTQRMEAEVLSKGESIVQINTIYYPGWGVIVDDQPVHIDYKNPEGVMRVTVPNGRHTLIAEFHETISRFSADILSGLSFFGYAGYMIMFRKRKNV